MTFELYADEISNRVSTMPGVRQADAGAFDNFFSGAGRYAMQGLAKTGRAIDLLGAVGPIIEDKITGGTEAQDRYFKEHDAVFNRAVDYWTPKPSEVGVAGEVVGQLLGTLPQVVASPGLAVASAQLSTAEDLVGKGVDATKAQAAGAVQAAGLGVGIWVPILGKTLTQRLLLGGAGFNVAQGMATRGATGVLLDGTPAAGDFKALDGEAVTLDALLGLAFGGLAHTQPGMRAEGEAWAKRLEDWSAKLKPSDVDALVAMRQAQHIGADSMPGRPVDVADQDAHVQRVRQAIDDLAADRPVSVEDMPAPRFESDPARVAQAAEVAKGMQAEAARLAEAEGVKPVGEGMRAEVTALHGSDSVFDEFQLMPGRNPALFFSIPNGRKTQAEFISEGPFGGNLYKVSISDGKKFDPLNDTVAAKIYAEIFPDRAGKPGKFIEYTDIYTDSPLIRAMRENGYNRVRVYEPSVHAFSEAVTDPSLVKILSRNGEPVTTKVDSGDTAKAAPTTKAGRDPLASEASRFARDNADLPIAIGKNADGSDIVTTPAKLLEDADAAMKRTQEDVRLLDVAAACLLGAS